MSSVIRLRRRTRKMPDPRLLVDQQSDEDAVRQLAAYAIAFTGCALVMYTAAVVAVCDSWSETLSLLWLIFVVAFSKLLIANGFLVIVFRADKQALADLAAQEEQGRRFDWRSNIRLRRSWMGSRETAGTPKLRLVIPASRSTPHR